ncbi:MAG: hypothetical protein NVS9B8_08620 [Candidatus Limnocylindrales bacterium]
MVGGDDGVVATLDAIEGTAGSAAVVVPGAAGGVEEGVAAAATTKVVVPRAFSTEDGERERPPGPVTEIHAPRV